MKNNGCLVALVTLALTGCYEAEQGSAGESHRISEATALLHLGGQSVAHLSMTLSLPNDTATIACDYLDGDKNVPFSWDRSTVVDFVGRLEDDCLETDAFDAVAYRRLYSRFKMLNESAEFESVVTLDSNERILLNQRYPQRRATLALDTLLGDHSHSYPIRTLQ